MAEYCIDDDIIVLRDFSDIIESFFKNIDELYINCPKNYFLDFYSNLNLKSHNVNLNIEESKIYGKFITQVLNSDTCYKNFYREIYALTLTINPLLYELYNNNVKNCDFKNKLINSIIDISCKKYIELYSFICQLIESINIASILFFNSNEINLISKTLKNVKYELKVISKNLERWYLKLSLMKLKKLKIFNETNVVDDNNEITNIINKIHDICKSYTVK
jgi:hypothetical protein